MRRAGRRSLRLSRYVVVGVAAGVAAAESVSAQTVPAQTALPSIVVDFPREAKPPTRTNQQRSPVASTTPSESAPSSPPAAASEKNITNADINALPTTRPGEVLETAPGLIVTQHSGEGKANQYFLRGFNLDHGTDLAITVDGMPANMRTHGHGQGYTDINFLIPELVQSVQVRKGPYYADEGDFSSAGAVHIDYLNKTDRAFAELSLGSFGYRRALVAGSGQAGNGTVLTAIEANAYNGPWDVPDKIRKINAVLRYSEGTADNGLSITGMAYRNGWTSTDQVAQRAIDQGTIGRFGSLDPSDGGNAERRFQVDAINLFNAQTNQIEYYYESQLRGEPASVFDRHVHPVEPLAMRASLRVPLQ